MSFLSPIFDANYRHALAKEEDPNRNLSGKMRMGIGFSNLLSWFGGIFLFVGFFLLIGFSSITDFGSVFFGSDVVNTTGKITSIESAHYTEFENPYFQYNYEYFLNQKKYTGRSYDVKNDMKLQDFVTVEYQRKSPDVSRIEGMRMGASPIWSLLFISIFPILGLITIAKGLESTSGEIILLKHGIITTATIFKTEEMITKGDDETSYNMYLKFTNKDGKEIESMINLRDDKTNFEGKVYPILYLSFKTSQCIFIKGLASEKINLIYN